MKLEGDDLMCWSPVGPRSCMLVICDIVMVYVIERGDFNNFCDSGTDTIILVFALNAKKALKELLKLTTTSQMG